MIVLLARVILTVWIAMVICVVLAAIIRIVWGIFCKLIALVCYSLACVLDALAWLWRQARWSTRPS